MTVFINVLNLYLQIYFLKRILYLIPSYLTKIFHFKTVLFNLNFINLTMKHSLGLELNLDV
jgi:hypothetical protein